MRLYRLAADQKNTTALIKSADAYSAGVGGLPKDEREAMRLYRLIDEQKAAAGKFMLEHTGLGQILTKLSRRE